MSRSSPSDKSETNSTHDRRTFSETLDLVKRSNADFARIRAQSQAEADLAQALDSMLDDKAETRQDYDRF